MIFPYLTIEENLLAGMETLKDRHIPQFVYDVFPVLQEVKNRKGGNLSGGQQQQLAVVRALVSKPTLLLLDKPTVFSSWSGENLFMRRPEAMWMKQRYGLIWPSKKDSKEFTGLSL